MGYTKAVAFILTKNNEFLAERRRTDKEAYPGMLAVPGGRMEPGEIAEDTLVREMMEELSVSPVEFEYLCSLEDPDVYDGLTIHYYHVMKWEGELSAGEAEELIWVDLQDHGRIEVEIDREAVALLMPMHG